MSDSQTDKLEAILAILVDMKKQVDRQGNDLEKITKDIESIGKDLDEITRKYRREGIVSLGLTINPDPYPHSGVYY